MPLNYPQEHSSSKDKNEDALCQHLLQLAKYQGSPSCLLRGFLFKPFHSHLF